MCSAQAGRLELDHYITHRFDGIEGTLQVTATRPRSSRTPYGESLLRLGS